MLQSTPPDAVSSTARASIPPYPTTGVQVCLCGEPSSAMWLGEEEEERGRSRKTSHVGRGKERGQYSKSIVAGRDSIMQAL